MQEDFIRKHLDMGGVAVVDSETHALIRFEYDNPIYQYYKAQFIKRTILMADLIGAMNDLMIFRASPLTSTPEKIEQIDIRIYPPDPLKE